MQRHLVLRFKDLILMQQMCTRLTNKRISLQKGSLFDNLVTEAISTSRSNRMLINDFTQVEETNKITFGNRYQYNATSGNEISPMKISGKYGDRPYFPEVVKEGDLK